jgi:hypothetical protein
MSQMGQERRIGAVRNISALPRRADVGADIVEPPVSARNGCEQLKQGSPYSITSSARASSIGGMSRPSAFAGTKLNSQGCVRDYDIDLELNELCGNFGEALSASFPSLSTSGGTARRCDQFVLTILYVPFLCPMIKAMPS